MTRHNVQDPLAFVLPVTTGELLTENDLLAGVVNVGIEEELAALALKGPSGQRARHFLNILLRIAAVDAERVQLHQLTRVVFVETASRALLQLLHQALALFGCGVLESLANRGRKLAGLSWKPDPTRSSRDDTGPSAASAAIAGGERRLRTVGGALPVV